MTRQSRRAASVAAACVFALAAAIGALSASVPPPAPAGPAAGTPPVVAGGYRQVHAAGVTGERVRVGVVDVTGFDTSDPSLAGRVAAARAFGPGATVANGGRNAHGTSAASVVATVAPDADLYLATFDSPAGYRRAVGWMVDEDVDVIVSPVSFYGKPGDGSAPVERAATRATREGVVFVAPAGNLARGHWAGRYASVRDGTLQFTGGPRNFLEGRGREVVIWLSWDGAHAADDYTVELYRTRGHRTRLVARSRPYPGDGVPNEHLEARVREGRYFFVVRGPPAATGARLELTSPTHDFEHARPAGSIAAPATARGAIAVGGYHRSAGRVEPFSSRGPTGDGRLGVDVVAPDRYPAAGGAGAFVGSSAAAPYVGGVAALVLDASPGLSPREVEHSLERTAVDAGPPGVDAAAGHGRVAPWDAVRAVRNGTDRRPGEGEP